LTLDPERSETLDCFSLPAANSPSFASSVSRDPDKKKQKEQRNDTIINSITTGKGSEHQSSLNQPQTLARNTAMKSMINNVTSTIFKKTAYALGMFSLMSIVTSGEVKANRIDANGNIAFSQGAWTHVASACTPDDDSIDYQLGGAGVSFPGSVTGEITLRCNITNVMDPDLPWGILEVVYRDPDGSGTANQVKVTLHQVGLDGTAESTITRIDPVTRRPVSISDPSLLTTFDSNTAASATSSTQVHTVGVNHTFNFAENAYYVKIKVKRNEGSTTNPAAFVVRLYAQGNIGG
jgi:hypothetical protein